MFAAAGEQSAREMIEAIDEGCERVDLDEW
jgi:hypothetical protein